MNTTNASTEWMTIAEAARYLRVSIGFLRKGVRLRRVPFARAGTKALRFRRSDLDRWLQANSCGIEVNYVERGR